MTEHPIVILAALMGLVTYGLRVVPFLLPLPRLSGDVVGAMRAMGPATLAAVAAVAVVFPATGPRSDADLMLPVWLGTGVCVALVVVRRSLALGIMGALAATLVAMSLLTR